MSTLVPDAAAQKNVVELVPAYCLVACSVCGKSLEIHPFDIELHQRADGQPLKWSCRACWLRSYGVEATDNDR